MPELVLTPDHRYFVGDTEYAGVTDVIKGAGLMGYLPGDKWYMDRGEYVHKAVFLYLKGQLDFDSIDEQIKGYVDSAIEYITLTKYKPTHLELELYDPVLFYAGKPDAVPLKDWKTGGNCKWHVLQMAAYDHLLHINHIPSEPPMNVHLNGKGKLPKVEPYKPHELKDAFRIFTAALTVHHWRKNNVR